MSFKRVLQSQAGFTLVEMMITAAIIGILLVAFSGWLFQNMRQTRDLNNTQNYSQLTGGVKDAAAAAEALSKSEAAQFTDLGVTPTPYQP
jgi:prepilin-type N-terminal cleavage/methylation domain-containing protein